MGAFKNLPMQNMEILSPNHPFEENHLPNQQFFSGATGGSAQRAADRRFSTTTAREESFLTEFLEWEFMGFWRSVVVLLFESDEFLLEVW